MIVKLASHLRRKATLHQLHAPIDSYVCCVYRFNAGLFQKHELRKDNR